MVQICAECHGTEVTTSVSSAGVMFRSQHHGWLSLTFLWFSWDISD